jgi:hypothetical protein
MGIYFQETDMQSDRIDKAHNFILENARLLERHLFNYLFLEESHQPVITALKAYQNPDGGFGQALEPDKRCPDSQPVDVQVAFEILDLVGALQVRQVQEELLLPACDFLAAISTPGGGVPFALPVVNDYPHAPWWQMEQSPPASLNPTAAIVGLLLKSSLGHDWLDGALEFCWQEIQQTETEAFHDLMPMITFLEYAPDRQRAQRHLQRITERIRRPGVVEMDPQAGGYIKMPLDWAPSPDSFCRQLFDDSTLELHLSALAGRQQPDGGWPINWDAISPGVELEWRGRKTIEALLTLQAYRAAGLEP